MSISVAGIDDEIERPAQQSEDRDEPLGSPASPPPRGGRRAWPSRRELIGEVFAYIDAFYNPIRRHSTLGYLSPLQFENSTLSHGGAGLAASRLASPDEKITTTTITT